MASTVAIVLVNFNGNEDTLACLDSLADITWKGARIYVVDNGSEISPKSEIEKRHPGVRVIEAGANLGFTGGNNVGARAALKDGADHVLLLNNDTRVDPDFLEPLVEALERNPKVGMVTPKIYFWGDEKMFWAYGATVNKWNARSPHIGVMDIDRGQFDHIREVDRITGCCMLIRREIFQTVGFLDDQFFLYCEEGDWCIRTRNAGYSLEVVPDSVIWHRGHRDAARVGGPFVQYLLTRNHLLLLRKHGSSFRLGGIIAVLYAILAALWKAVRCYTTGDAALGHSVLLGVWNSLLGNYGPPHRYLKKKTTPRPPRVTLFMFLFPPLGGTSSIRNLRLARELKRRGWNVEVVAPKAWNYFRDPTLSTEGITVHRTLAPDPAAVTSPLRRMGLSRVADWLEQKFIVPDRSVLWAFGAYRFARRADILYTSSPPHSLHLVARMARRRGNMKWVAGFRDEWSTNEARPRPDLAGMEQNVLETADAVTSVSAWHVRHLHGKTQRPVHIPMGFDPTEHTARRREKGNQLTITFAGTMYGLQKPDRILGLLEDLVREGKLPQQDLKLRFVGHLWEGENRIRRSPLRIETPGFVNRSEVWSYLSDSDVLLLSLLPGATRVPTNKLNDYLLARRPILASVPAESEAAEIVRSTRTGYVAPSDNDEEARSTLIRVHRDWKSRKLRYEPDPEELARYELSTSMDRLEDLLRP